MSNRLAGDGTFFSGAGTTVAGIENKFTAVIPDMMQAWQMTGFGGPEVMALRTIPVPSPGPGAVLVRVKAAGVNPADWKLRTGRMGLTPPLPHTMGAEFSGVIARLGDGVAQWNVGDAIYGFVPFDVGGPEAEYVVVGVAHMRSKPTELAFETAAAAPVAALTAWNALFELGELKSGQRVLIHGASGAVGSIAAQLAKQAGAYVIGTASAKHIETLRSLGVDAAIDYRRQRFEDVARDLDLVIDGVGDETTVRSLSIIKPGGALVTLSSQADRRKCSDLGIRCVLAYSFVPTRPDVFSTIGKLIETGRIKIAVGEQFPLDRADDALALVYRGGGARGRVVLTMPSSAA